MPKKRNNSWENIDENMIVNLKDDFVHFATSEVAQKFFNDIRKEKVLSKEETYEQILIAQNSQDEQKVQKAMDKIVKGHIRIVISFANKMGTPSEILDLINEGVFGLIEATKRFDVKTENSFPSYALWWVRHFVLTFIKNHRDVVRDKTPNDIKKQRALQDYNLAQTSTGGWKKTLYLSDKKDDDRNLEDLPNIATYLSQNNIMDALEEDERKILVGQLLSLLNQEERDCISMLYGIGKGNEFSDNFSLEDIAERMKISRPKVFRLKERAMKKMKDYFGLS